ncbi:MAG: molybdopterin-containing oxidoreductase family protein [Desulfobacterales bacterium]
MQPLRTVCARDCYDSCGIIVQFNEAGRIQPIAGDPTHPVTRGFTCPRGRKDHKRIYRNRIQQPFMRGHRGLEPCEWDTALEMLVRRLRQTLETHGPEAVLFLNYAGNMGLLASSWPERLWNAIGASRTDGAVCSQSGHTALGLHFGESYGLEPEDLLSADLIVFWGFNAVVSAPHIWNLAASARSAKGTPIFVVDPRQSETAKRADRWLAPAPGTDAALAYGVIHSLFESGTANIDFLQEWSTGCDRLVEVAGKWPFSRVSELTGLPGSDIGAFSSAFQESRQCALMLGIGMQKRDAGAEAVRAAAFIGSVLGQHRRFFYGNGSAYPIARHRISGRSMTETPSRVTSQVSVADRIDRGDFRFIFVNCHNPALTLPGAGRLQSGLRREDVFTVVHETHWSRTARLADLALPAPTHFEKEDIVIPWGHPYVLRLPAVVDRTTDSRSETEVMGELVRRLELPQPWLREDPWQVLRECLGGAFVDGTFDDLMAGRRLRLRRLPADRYGTPSGRIEFVPSNVPPGVAPLPDPQKEGKPVDGFLLLNSALPHYTHTQFQEVYGAIPNRLAIHPEDADKLGVEDGETVALHGRRGEVSLVVFRSDTVPRGVVWTPRQWEDASARPLNSLFGTEPQPLGGGPRLNSERVAIRRIEAAP